MPDIDAVVFDIGNVLIGWQPEQFYDRVIGADNRKRMFGDVDLHAMNERVDRGEDFTGTIYETADEYPQWHDEIRMWHDRWIEMAQPAFDHSVHLLRQLRRRSIPVLALSNFGIGSFEHAKKFYEFLDEFDQAFISGYLGVTKPSTDIYAIVERECGVTPTNLLFTDDRIDNIQAATERGWQTHLFDTPQGFADRLTGAGLLSKQEAQF